jgi:hypothetical protein
VWAVAIVVLCASVTRRIADRVDEQLRAIEDQGLHLCSEGWKTFETRLAIVNDELRVCREETAYEESMMTFRVSVAEVCDA